MSRKAFEDFTNLYKVQKTLRFALKPTSPTKKYVLDFVKQDEKRADEYKKAKKIIDEYHKDYISKKLEDFRFSLEDLKVNEWFTKDKFNDA